MLKKLLFCLSIIFYNLITIYGTGFHYPYEIWPGQFMNGDYYFQGGLGIGTTNPSELLHVKGIRGAIALTDLDNFNDPNDWIFLNPAYNDLRIGWHDDSAGVETNILTIKSSGNVGIGTSSPGHKLDIVGGHGRVESGYSWLTNSDARYKTDVKTINGSLDRVMNIRGVYYKVINDTTNKTNIGVIAQEVEAEFPELVVTDENGYKSVKYSEISAVLIQAIKEQQKQIEEKDNEIKNLQDQINSISQRLSALENN